MRKHVSVTPSYFTPRGEALCPPRGNHNPLLVWAGIPGERAMVRVFGGGRHQDRGEWVKADEPSPHRVEPPCEKYSACGGCPWMHLDASGQERAHRDLVQRAFESEGISLPVGAWHGSPDGLTDFRHIVKVGIAKNEKGRTRVGAWGRNSRRIVPVPNCDVAAPVLNKTMAVLAHHILDLDVWPFEPETGKGVLRAAVLRASRTTGKVLVTLVAGRSNVMVRRLAEEVANGVSEVSGVWLHLNDSEGNAIFSRDAFGAVNCLPLSGEATIEERIGGVSYQIGPGDFFQTNPGVAEVLYRRTIDRLAPTGEDTVVDLYCGVGGLALQAAFRGAGFTVGIEEVDGAVQRAKTTARQNRLTNAEFHAGKVFEVLPELLPRLDGTRPLVTVNPARRGLEDGVVEAIASLKPRRLAYISCNPAALARDLVDLARVGLHPVGEAELFDMFPNTPHVECLVVLEAKDADEAPKRRAPRRKVVRKR